MKRLLAFVAIAASATIFGPAGVRADTDLSLPAGQMWATAGIPTASGVAVLQARSTTLGLLICTGGQGCELGVVTLAPGTGADGYELGHITTLTNPEHIRPPITVSEGDAVVFAMVYPDNAMVMIDYDALVSAVLYAAPVPSNLPGS